MILGVDLQTMAATQEYMFWTVKLGATPAILNVVMAYLFVLKVPHYQQVLER